MLIYILSFYSSYELLNSSFYLFLVPAMLYYKIMGRPFSLGSFVCLIPVKWVMPLSSADKVILKLCDWPKPVKNNLMATNTYLWE